MKNIGIVCGPQRIERLALSEKVLPYKKVNCDVDCLIVLDSNREILQKRRIIEDGLGCDKFFLLSYKEKFFEEIQSYRELILPEGTLIILYCLAVRGREGGWLDSSLWQKQEIDVFLSLLPDFLKWIFLLFNKPNKN